MNQKLRVIVPAQCTQLSIVQVLRASAITAQLMPLVWLQLELRITTQGLIQKEGKINPRRAATSISAEWKKNSENKGERASLRGHLNQSFLSTEDFFLTSVQLEERYSSFPTYCETFWTFFSAIRLLSDQLTATSSLWQRYSGKKTNHCVALKIIKMIRKCREDWQLNDWFLFKLKLSQQNLKPAKSQKLKLKKAKSWNYAGNN